MKTFNVLISRTREVGDEAEIEVIAKDEESAFKKAWKIARATKNSGKDSLKEKDFSLEMYDYTQSVVVDEVDEIKESAK